MNPAASAAEFKRTYKHPAGDYSFICQFIDLVVNGLYENSDCVSRKSGHYMVALTGIPGDEARDIPG